MSGRIRDADIALIRERVGIADVVGAVVTLRSAGSGRLKGLCPFHEEKTPSFHVNPAMGFYHCFGCGESGDIISFVRGTQQLGFQEAVEVLARDAGVELVFERGGSAAGAGAPSSRRSRLHAACAAAQDFFVAALARPEAGAAREFLAARGFDDATAAAWGCGYAPSGWTALTDALIGAGFRREELIAAYLAKPSARGGLIDCFRGRLIWPIRDVKGDVVAFNARRLDEADTGPKYLNSADTELFSKSRTLLGLDVAKKEIARRRQVVVVEGVTDVMACHAAGVPTAVATCGTAFGAEHIKSLRLLMMDSDTFRGEVIFTFDGDAAGQKAALRAFRDDQRFVTQTFVAVEPSGLDPCELRLASGDEAVRDLVARRVPLVEFVLRARLDGYDLDSAEGRVAALREAAPLVAEIKDRALRPEYTRRVAGWLGMDEAVVAAAVGESSGAPGAPAQRLPPAGPGSSAAARAAGPANAQEPDPRVVAVEAQALAVAVQAPALAGPRFDALVPSWFLVPAHRAVREAILQAGGCSAAPGGAPWVQQLLATPAGAGCADTLQALAVAEMTYLGDLDDRYAGAVVDQVELFALERQLAELQSRVQRLNPVESPTEYARAAGELFALEGHRRALRERGTSTV